MTLTGATGRATEAKRMTDTWTDLAADLDDAGQPDFAERVRKLTGVQPTTWRGDENR